MNNIIKKLKIFSCRVQGIIVNNVCIFWKFLIDSSQFEYALYQNIYKEFIRCYGPHI